MSDVTGLLRAYRYNNYCHPKHDNNRIEQILLPSQRNWFDSTVSWLERIEMPRSCCLVHGHCRISKWFIRFSHFPVVQTVGTGGVQNAGGSRQHPTPSRAVPHTFQELLIMQGLDGRPALPVVLYLSVFLSPSPPLWWAELFFFSSFFLYLIFMTCNGSLWNPSRANRAAQPATTTFSKWNCGVHKERPDQEKRDGL